MTIVAPDGIVTLMKRMPTVWILLARTSSRSLLVRSMVPLGFSSASSELVATRTSRVVAVDGLTVMAKVWPVSTFPSPSSTSKSKLSEVVLLPSCT